MLRPGLADSSVPATLQGKVAANLNAAQAGSLAAQPGIISRDDARKTNNQASAGASCGTTWTWRRLWSWRRGGTWTKPVCTMFTLCAPVIQFSLQ